MVEHKFPLDIAPAHIMPWFEPTDVAVVTPLAGWHNSVYRIDLNSGESFALRVHVPSEDLLFVAPTLQIAAAYARVLPFVPAPIETLSGELHALLERRVATLWPCVAGAHGQLQRTSSDAAAKCLATIHTAGASLIDELRGVGPEQWNTARWRENERWSLAANERFISQYADEFDVEANGEDLIVMARADCDGLAGELAGVTSADMTCVPIHGDFYPNNILVDSDGLVSGVIDWDESRIDWRTWDVANALLEYCAGPAGMDLDANCAREFIASYESVARPLTRSERQTLPTLIRARKLDEFMFSLGESLDGAVLDWEYLNQSCRGWLQIRELREL